MRNVHPDEIERILEWRFPAPHVRNSFTNLNNLFDEPDHHNNYSQSFQKMSALESIQGSDDDEDSDSDELKCKIL